MRKDKHGMRRLKQSWIRGLAMLALLFLSVAAISPSAYAAGDAQFTLNSGGSTNVGDTYTVTVSVNATAGDDANSVDAEISYPTSLLTLSSISVNLIFEAPPTGSGVGCASNSASGGTVSIACASSSPFNGVTQYATLSFTVKAAGSGSVVITSGSGIDGGTGGGQDIWDHTIANLNPTFTGSAASAGSSGGGSLQNGNGGGLSDTGIAILSIVAIAAAILLGAVIVWTAKRRKQAGRS